MPRKPELKRKKSEKEEKAKEEYERIKILLNCKKQIAKCGE